MAVKKARSGAKKRKKVRYKKLEFKISAQQKKRLDTYCRMKKTTALKVVKTALHEYMERHAADLPEAEVVSKNQLKLFDLSDENTGPQQTVLFS